MTRDRKEYYKKYYEANKEAIIARKKDSSKAYRDKNNEKLKEKGKEYYIKNKDKILERTNRNRKLSYRSNPQKALEKQKQWKINNQEKYLLQGARARAKKYNVPFEIDVSDIDIPSHCPYLGIKLEPFSEWSSPSLDKIRPELGYVKGNVQVVSTLANTMKSSASIEQLVIFATNVLLLHKTEEL
jgi:hypothetical protein